MTEPEIPPTPTSEWDALEAMRIRAAEAKARRDSSAAELREVMDDQEVLEEFGIDLSRLDP
jgi:hypothetical protein